MKDFANTLIEASRIHEQSFNGRAPYNTIRDSVKKAVERVGFDKKEIEPITIMLTYAWDVSLRWAADLVTADQETKDE